MRAPGAREREVVLRVIYQMSEAQFRQYWIAKVFRAEAAGGPRIIYSNDMAAELVRQFPEPGGIPRGGPGAQRPEDPQDQWPAARGPGLPPALRTN